MLNYSSFIKIIAVGTSLMSFMVVNKAAAQVITQITVDPYNDSNFQSIPIDVSTPKPTSIKKPKAQVKPKTVYIKGSSTPTRPSQLKGNFTSSQKSLPPIPSLSEPYSEQQNNDDVSIDSTNSSISVSPFDITPKNTNTISNPQNKTRVIEVSPANSPIRVIKPENNQQIKPTLPQPTNTRRSLRDVLVQSNRVNQNAYKVLVKFNNDQEKIKIKSLYPEAFTKTIKGNSFLQIGIFSSKKNVEQVSQSIANIGFKAIVIQ